jgi:hypothetical protein
MIPAVLAATLAAAQAHAQAEANPSPIPANSPAALANASIDADVANMQGTTVDRANEARDRRIDMNVGQVPNVRTPPPSNDRFHDPRTRTESSWTTQQRGTNATGLWPMPSTGGQPGTLQ